jgi:hypothetical protein
VYKRSPKLKTTSPFNSCTEKTERSLGVFSNTFIFIPISLGVGRGGVSSYDLIYLASNWLLMTSFYLIFLTSDWLLIMLISDL